MIYWEILNWVSLEFMQEVMNRTGKLVTAWKEPHSIGACYRDYDQIFVIARVCNREDFAAQSREARQALELNPDIRFFYEVTSD